MTVLMRLIQQYKNVMNMLNKIHKWVKNNKVIKSGNKVKNCN
jgi:hypothetical protein